MPSHTQKCFIHLLGTPQSSQVDIKINHHVQLGETSKAGKAIETESDCQEPGRQEIGADCDKVHSFFLWQET